MPELVIFIGLQAAGKSTFYARRFAGTHAHVSKDLMPRGVRDRQRRQLTELARQLATGRSAVVDNTNPRRADRAPLIELGKRLGARVIGYFFEPQVGDSIRRNDARSLKVPKVAIFATATKLEPPAPDEGFDELYFVRIEGADFDVRRATS